MTPAHPDRAELLQLLDGEVTENRAAELRSHLARCPACAAEQAAQRRLVGHLAAPVDGVPSAGALERLLARVDEVTGVETTARAGTPRRWPLRWVLVSGLAGVAAALVLVVMPGPDPRDAFSPRGTPVSWGAKVDVDLFALGDPPRRLEPGASVAVDAAFVGVYRNLDDAPAFLLAFAEDASGQVHWLYPAFAGAGTDPAAVELAPGSGATPFPDAVELDHPAPGPLRCIMVITREPLRVSTVEALPSAERDPIRLRGRWPAASIRTLDLVVSQAGRRP